MFPASYKPRYFSLYIFTCPPFITSYGILDGNQVFMETYGNSCWRVTIKAMISGEFSLVAVIYVWVGVESLVNSQSDFSERKESHMLTTT